MPLAPEPGHPPGMSDPLPGIAVGQGGDPKVGEFGERKGPVANEWAFVFGAWIFTYDPRYQGA